MAVKPIPEGYHSVTPYLIVTDGVKAIEFYKKAFGATELCCMASPDGKVAHAEVMIGNSAVMLAEEFPDMGYRGPQALGGTAVSLLIYVPDVDARFQQAIAAGATEIKPLKDQFYGDRSGTLKDPFGHVWTIATHIEDVSGEEIGRRFEALMKQQGAA